MSKLELAACTSSKLTTLREARAGTPPSQKRVQITPLKREYIVPFSKERTGVLFESTGVYRGTLREYRGSLPSREQREQMGHSGISLVGLVELQIGLARGTLTTSGSRDL